MQLESLLAFYATCERRGSRLLAGHVAKIRGATIEASDLVVVGNSFGYDHMNDAISVDGLDRRRKIEWDFYEDSLGEESLKILLLLDDATTDKELKKAPVHLIKRGIMDSLAKHKVRLFPYFFFDRKGEHEARKTMD